MARLVLLIGAAAWLTAGVAAAALGILAAGWLYARLPPVPIDAAAVGGGVTAIGVAFAVVGLVQAGALVALGSGRRAAYSAAILVCATLAATMLMGAVAAATGAATAPELAPPLIGAAFVAAVATLAYGVAAARLIGSIGDGGGV